MVQKDLGSKCGTGSRLADTYEIVDDPSSDSIISWSENGKSFIVWKPEEFARDFLPKLLLCNDFSAFTRMLYRFDFRKIGSGRWEFADKDFVRGKPKLIHRKINRKRVEGKIALKIFKSQRRKNLEEALESQVDQLLADRLQSLQEATSAIENQLQSLEKASKAITDLLHSCQN